MTTKPLIVAVDDGYAQIKVFGANPSGGAPIARSIRSSIRHGAISSVSGDGAIATYSTNDGAVTMTVSDEVAGESTQFDGFHTSDMNRILIAHGVREAGYAGLDGIHLWAGLPVADYFRNDGSGEKNKDIIARKIRNLSEKVSLIPAGATQPPSYGHIDIGCQALAAFIDYAVDDEFQDRDVPTDSVAVVDIGGRTTDIAVVLGGARIDPKRSGTRDIGVLDVQKELGNLVRSHFNTTDRYSTKVLDTAVKTGAIKLWGSNEDIASLVAQASAVTSQKLTNFIKELLGNASDIDRVIFVGGGAALFKESASHFRNALIGEDPEFANARGLYKFANLG